MIFKISNILKIILSYYHMNTHSVIKNGGKIKYKYISMICCLENNVIKIIGIVFKFYNFYFVQEDIVNKKKIDFLVRHI